MARGAPLLCTPMALDRPSVPLAPAKSDSAKFAVLADVGATITGHAVAQLGRISRCIAEKSGAAPNYAKKVAIVRGCLRASRCNSNHGTVLFFAVPITDRQTPVDSILRTSARLIGAPRALRGSIGPSSFFERV